jgi:hypothetical protein
MIFLHPVGDGDASGYILFLDDGRSFLVKDRGLSSTPKVEVVEEGEELGELDRVLPR